MLLVTKRNLKLLRNNFYSIINFTQLKSTLINLESSTIAQDFTTDLY
jgi:hypothetical protein